MKMKIEERERKTKEKTPGNLLVLTNQPSLSLSLLDLMKWQLLGCSRGIERASAGKRCGWELCAVILSGWRRVLVERTGVPLVICGGMAGGWGVDTLGAEWGVPEHHLPGCRDVRIGILDED